MNSRAGKGFNLKFRTLFMAFVLQMHFTLHPIHKMYNFLATNKKKINFQDTEKRLQEAGIENENLTIRKHFLSDLLSESRNNSINRNFVPFLAPLFCTLNAIYIQMYVCDPHFLSSQFTPDSSQKYSTLNRWPDNHRVRERKFFYCCCCKLLFTSCFATTPHRR